MRWSAALVVLSACADGALLDKGDSGGADSAACEAPTTWHQDADGDGFGSGTDTATQCEPPDGYVTNDADCDDLSSNVYPGAIEICNDGRPNNCDDTDGVAAAEACSSGGPFSLRGGDAWLTGEGEDAASGTAVAGAGDVDGDLRGDLLIGAPGLGPGAAYLVRSPVSGAHSLSEATAILSVDDVDYIDVGSSLSSAGDVDGDGLPDVVIGAPDPGGVTSEAGAGTAYLVSGLVSGTVDLAGAEGLLRGEERMDNAGTGVAGLGDVDGDGWDDVLVGARGVDGPSIESDAGYCSDVDDDGAAPGAEVGAAYLVSGPAFGVSSLADAQAKLLGEDSGDVAGRAVARAGDLDGDGLSDLLIGAMGHCAGGYDAGATYVVLGPVSGTGYLADADGKVVGVGTESHVGEALSSAGDVDGDGTPDVLIGAPEIGLQGRAYLVRGPALGTMSVSDAVASFIGESTGARAGQALSSAGDLNGDGFDDLLIGAFLLGPDSTYPGAAYVVYGPVSGALNLGDVQLKFIGREYDTAGWAVAGVGDTNLDGLPDLLIGVIGDNTAYHWAGAAALILGGGPAFDGTWGP